MIIIGIRVNKTLQIVIAVIGKRMTSGWQQYSNSASNPIIDYFPKIAHSVAHSFIMSFSYYG